jgi:hypothetical protein
MEHQRMEAKSALGHNNPPNDAQLLTDHLHSAHAKLLDNAGKLVEAVGRIPEKCEDQETAGKIGDLIKMLTGDRKKLETARVAEKEPYLSLGRAVDGFFKTYLDRIDQAKLRAQKPLDAFLKAEAEKERLRRIEEAARLQREADEKAALAAKAEEANLQPIAESTFIDAQVTEQQAQKMQASAEAKPAELAKSRGESGSFASLRTRWVGEVEDRNTLDLEALRPHINFDSLQRAVNAFVAAGGRELKGAKIYEKSETVVR